MSLPTNRTTANTAAEHVADHNGLHGAYNNNARLFHPLFTGTNLTSFGHSYFTGGNASNGNGMNTMLFKRHHFNQHTNRSVAGRTTIDISREALSYWTNANASDGWVLVVSGANDAYGDTSNWPGMPTVGLAAMRAIIDISRTNGTRIENTAATYTGTWTQVSDTTASGGTYHKTTTQNDYVEVSATPVAGELLVVLQGISTTTPGAGTGAGANYSITVDGGTAITGSTSFGAQAHGPNFPLTVILSGLTNTAHTIRVTKTDASTSNELRFDCLMYKDVTVPTIVLVQQQLVTSKGSTFVTAARQTMTSAAALYPATEVAIADAVTGWDSTNMVSTDNLHYNDRGHWWNTLAIEDAVNTLTWRNGQNRLLT